MLLSVLFLVMGDYSMISFGKSEWCIWLKKWLDKLMVVGDVCNYFLMVIVSVLWIIKFTRTEYIWSQLLIAPRKCSPDISSFSSLFLLYFSTKENVSCTLILRLIGLFGIHYKRIHQWYALPKDICLMPFDIHGRVLEKWHLLVLMDGY